MKIFIILSMMTYMVVASYVMNQVTDRVVFCITGLTQKEADTGYDELEQRSLKKLEAEISACSTWPKEDIESYRKFLVEKHTDYMVRTRKQVNSFVGQPPHKWQ
jgi:hypothetical protein